MKNQWMLSWFFISFGQKRPHSFVSVDKYLWKILYPHKLFVIHSRKINLSHLMVSFETRQTILTKSIFVEFLTSFIIFGLYWILVQIKIWWNLLIIFFPMLRAVRFDALYGFSLVEFSFKDQCGIWKIFVKKRTGRFERWVTILNRTWMPKCIWIVWRSDELKRRRYDQIHSNKILTNKFIPSYNKWSHHDTCIWSKISKNFESYICIINIHFKDQLYVR